MDINPFDQFSNDVRGALPPSNAPPPGPNAMVPAGQKPAMGNGAQYNGGGNMMNGGALTMGGGQQMNQWNQPQQQPNMLQGGGAPFGAPAPAQGGMMVPAPAPGQGGMMTHAPAPGGMMTSAPGQGGMMVSAPGQGGMMNSAAPGQGGMMAPAPAQGGMMVSAPGQGGMMNSAPGQGGMMTSNALVPSDAPSNPYALTQQQQPPQQQQQPQNMQPWGQPPQERRLSQGQMTAPGHPVMDNGAFGGPPGQPPQGAPPPPPQKDPSMIAIFGAAPAIQQQQGQQQSQQQVNDPFGAAPVSPPQRPSMGQGQDSLSNIFGAAPAAAAPVAAAPANDGFDVFGSAPAPAAPVPAIANDPWGAAPAASTALVPSNEPNDDPFGIFGGSNAAPAPGPPAILAAAPPPAPELSVVPRGSAEPWDNGSVGVSSSAPDAVGLGTQQPNYMAAGVAAGNQPNFMADQFAGQQTGPTPAEAPRLDNGLPPGGEFYDARIFTPTLGVMFFKPQELTDSLFLQTDKEIVDSLDERPVVAFIVEGSSARSAGVELGHVLLKVNGIDVKNPKEASRLIKEGPRPLPLLFYVPDTTVVVAEGEHMVKYDSRETGAPSSSKDWKPKYVVVGGIIAQSWMINMYRSKSEYDIAVIETQARRPVSVKVKQFSLQGARIQNDWQGPQMVKYKNKLHPWKFIVVLPVSRNPIKISSPNLTQLKPVHEGIRRILASQTRDRGVPPPNTAAPIQRQPNQGDPYGNNQQHHQQQQHQQQQQHIQGPPQQGGYQPDQGGVSSGRRNTHPDY